MTCRNRNTKHKLTCVRARRAHPGVRGREGPGTIPGHGPPTGAVPLNIPVWPNAVAGSYPVCDISKYVGTLDLYGYHDHFYPCIELQIYAPLYLSI